MKIGVIEFMKDLTKGNPVKLIAAFALPILIGNLLQLTYNLVDTRIVGQFLGSDALAAVGATNSLSNLIIGFLQGITNGFAVIVAQSFGAKDIKALKKTVGSTLVLGLIMAVSLTVLALIFLKPLLRILNTPEDIMDLSYSYIFIIFAGMTITMLYNVCAAVLRAIGDSVTPLIFLSFSVVLNVAGDYIAVVWFKWGVCGAAGATVFAQFAAMIICFVYMLGKYKILRISRSDCRLEPELTKKMFYAGLSMGFMSSLVALGTLTLQGAINSFGKSIIVAHTAARKLTEMFMLMFSVFGTTMATYCGQNLGAGKIRRIKQGLVGVIGVTWGWCILVIIASYTVAPQLIKMVTGSNEAEVINTASFYLRVNTVLYFVPAVICIVRNAMQGLNDHVTPIISSSIELIGKVLVVVLLVPKLGYMGIIISEPIVWVVMVIPLIVRIFTNPVLKKEGFTQDK